MNIQQAIAKLTTLGFKFINSDAPTFGITVPEPYQLKNKNHFKPKIRTVFIGSCNDGFYVTSNLHGDFRLYRCRITYTNYPIANIFGKGKTLRAAVAEFVRNFKSKTYNVTQ